MAEKLIRETQVDLSRINGEIDAVNTRIDGLGNVFNYKGRVDTKEQLPSSGNKEGDLYLVGTTSSTDKAEYFWSGSTWEYLGNTSNQNYATETAPGISQIATTAEVNAGTNDNKYVTPSKMKAFVDNKISTKADLVNGKVPDSQLPEQIVNVADKTLSNVSTIDPNSKVQVELNNKADLDLANTGRITNCITKIPQDINLELSADGTLTLKAGSKVYKGDGTAVSINSDTVLYIQTGFSNTQGLVFYNPTSDDFCPLERCFSGATAPTVTGNTNFWYDTAEKIVKYTNNQGQTWNDFSISLPLAVVTVGSNGTVTSIDQVFNGFGFIGSVPFILPGVECLRTSGRNTDGTLKSAPTTISTVLIPEHISDILRTEIYINGATSSVALQKGGYVYNEQDNLFYFGTAARNVCFAFSVSRDSTGRILSLTPQNTFHAVDYNDLAKVDGLAQQTDSLVQNGRIGFPNLSAKVSINSGYTAPSNGWVLIISSNSNANTEMKFDNAQVYFQGAAGSAASAACGFIPIKKGQVVTITGEVSVKQFMPSL